MPPARPFWKGYLKLSLVSCPIALLQGGGEGGSAGGETEGGMKNDGHDGEVNSWFML
jgi:hypothetical protein